MDLSTPPKVSTSATLPPSNSSTTPANKSTIVHDHCYAHISRKDHDKLLDKISQLETDLEKARKQKSKYRRQLKAAKTKNQTLIENLPDSLKRNIVHEKLGYRFSEATIDAMIDPKGNQLSQRLQHFFNLEGFLEFCYHFF